MFAGACGSYHCSAGVPASATKCSCGGCRGSGRQGRQQPPQTAGQVSPRCATAAFWVCHARMLGRLFWIRLIYEVLSILQCVSSGVLVYLSVCRSASGPLSVDWDAAELCLDLLLVSGRQQQGGTQRQQHASLLQQTSAVCSLASSATSRGSYVRVWLCLCQTC